MNKYSLLLVTGALLTFSACEVEHEEGVDSQAMIDSMVDARVGEIEMELQMKNDSIINELAMWRADSILAARSGKPVARSTRPRPSSTPVKTVTTKNEQQTSDVKPATVGNGKPSMKNDDGTVGNGKPSMKNNDDGTVGNGKPSMK